MELWNEQLDKQLLTIPWSCCFDPTSDDPPLLLKCDYQTEPSGFTILGTNLQEVFIETLNQRQLARRIQDALTESKETQTQSQSLGGGGDEADKLTRDVMDTLLDGVASGSAKVTLESVAYTHEIIISLPTFHFRFLCDSLGEQSAPCLKRQLITPLLGCASSLLSLIPKSAEADGSLAKAIDASAKVESLQSGRTWKNFFGAGTTSFRRWTKRYSGVKEKHLDPVTLDAPKARRTPPPGFISPSKAPKAPLPSTSTSASLPASAPVATPTFNFSRPSGKGEKISWEDSQPAASTSTGKSGDGLGEEEEDEEEEEEKELTPPPPAQIPSSPATKALAREKRKLSPPDPPQEIEHGDPPTDEEPKTEDEEEPALAPSGSRASPVEMSPPSPTQEDMDEKANEKERKKREKEEKEKEEEMRIRRLNAAKLKKANEAKAKAGGAAKKKVKRL